MKYDFEQNMKHVLEIECQDVTASRNLKDRIDEAILDSQKFDSYTSYEDMDKGEKELGYAVDSVETFVNGYQFAQMYVEDVDAWDEEGNKAYTLSLIHI